MKLRLKSVYVMWSLDFPWRAKIGISHDPKSRRNSIQTSIRQALRRDVDVNILIQIPLLHARMIEGGLHNALRRLECKSMTGSGYTEWFWFLNPVTFIFVWLLFYAYGFENYSGWCAFFWLAPIPLDFVIFALILALVQYAFVGAVAYGIMWFFLT